MHKPNLLADTKMRTGPPFVQEADHHGTTDTTYEP